jgi:hypothetical protein
MLPSPPAVPRGLLPLLGLASCTLALAAEPEKGMTRQGGGAHALIIGVADYDDPSIQDLSYSHRDAYALSESLLRSGHYGADDVIVLTTDQPDPGLRPTHQNIQAQLAALSEVRGADSLLVFFSGHGVAELAGRDRVNFLLPADTNNTSASRLTQSALSVQWLESTLQGMAGFRAHALFMDACRSSPTEKSLGGRLFVQPKTTQRLDVGSSLPDLQVVYSAEFGQPSFEAPTLGLGQFTYALRRGLEGEADGAHLYDQRVSDGWVTVSELHQWSTIVLPQMDRPQIPYLGGEAVGDMVVAPSQPTEAERREDVRCPSSPRTVENAAADALNTFHVDRPAEFLRYAERAVWSAECSDELLPPELIADVHRVSALRAFLAHDVRTASMALGAVYALGADPLAGVPNPGPALRDLAQRARVEAAEGDWIGHPEGTEIWVNGHRTNYRPRQGVAFVQVQNWDGSLQPSAWLRPDQLLPMIAPPPPDDWLVPTRTALGWSAGATALASAGFLTCNLLQLSAFQEVEGDIAAGNPPDKARKTLERHQQLANACATGAWVGGSFAVGLGVTSLGLRLKF